MPQGAIKQKTAASGKKPSILGPKRGTKVIKPKKAILVKQQKVTKKHSAGLIAKTEQNLAEKAGHLEMLAGGKKRKDKTGEKSRSKPTKK